MEPTIAAIATAPGSGGLAVIRVSGSQAIGLVSSLLSYKNPHKCLENTPGYSALFAQLFNHGQLVDEVIALVFRAPHSYTGEDTVEISCHGGALISQQVLQACLDAGAKMASAGEFTRRAFMNGKLSLAQAEAVVELISATSQQEIACAGRVLAGHQNIEINQIKSELIALASHIAAWIDYPDEGVPAVEEAVFLQKVNKNRMKLAFMLAEYENNSRIKRGIKVVISGRPNVGKSTLFNLLVGTNRAITTPLAGTTRDVLLEEILVQGIPVQLCDTAGLRESADPIEAEGIRRTNIELETGDIFLRVVDASDKNAEKEASESASSGKPSLFILNKSDLADTPPTLPQNTTFFQTLVVSATAEPQETAQKIRSALADLMQRQVTNPDSMLLTSQRQQQEALAACQRLEEIEEDGKSGIIYDITSINLEAAIQSLSALTGENASNAIIDGVFSTFCVGK